MELSRQSDAGGTALDHTIAAAENGLPGAQEVLDSLDPPPEAAYLHEWFFDLKRAAPQTGMGATVISYSEIDAWCRQWHRVLTPWELSTIMKMDAAFNSAVSKTSKKG